MFPRKLTWTKWCALAVAICVAAIFLVFWNLRARYERRLQRQIWPAAALKILPISSAPVGSLPTVMLLGDSRVAQWSVPQLAHWRVVNAGVGGATTGQIRLVTPRLLAEVRPDAVVLEVGINDLKFLGLKPAMSTAIVSLATSNLLAIVNECAGHGCKVVVLETWPAGKPSLARRLVWNAAIPASVIQLNTQLRTLESPQRGIHVVDLFGEAGLTPEPKFYVDTLHFTQETYARLTPVLAKELDVVRPAAK